MSLQTKGLLDIVGTYTYVSVWCIPESFLLCNDMLTELIGSN